MPTRFRTIKLVTYAVRRRGGWIDKQPPRNPDLHRTVAGR